MRHTAIIRSTSRISLSFIASDKVQKPEATKCKRLEELQTSPTMSHKTQSRLASLKPQASNSTISKVSFKVSSSKTKEIYLPKDFTQSRPYLQSSLEPTLPNSRQRIKTHLKERSQASSPTTISTPQTTL